MTIRVVSARRWLAIAAIAAIALSVSAGSVSFEYGNDDVDPGRYSAFTREELRSNWHGAKRFPILVPARLPAGAEEMDGGLGFNLSNVVTDPVRHPSRRSWVSYYDSDVLGGSFRIFQRPTDDARQEPCGPNVGQPFVQRRVGDVVVTICSSDFSSGNREYWESVTFTGDLEEVGWLRG